MRNAVLCLFILFNNIFGARVVYLVRIVAHDTAFQSIRLRLFRKKKLFAVCVERSTISAESATTSIAINETISPSSTSQPTSAASLESTVFVTANATGMMNIVAVFFSPIGSINALRFYFGS